jgi:hypothetical protein
MAKRQASKPGKVSGLAALFKATKAATPAKRSKYRNIPTRVGDILFPSKKEAARYEVLLLLQKAGKIRHLARQTPYPFRVQGVLVCTYYADFEYWEDGDIVVEDVKGIRTGVYIIKRKLMQALYGIKIRET